MCYLRQMARVAVIDSGSGNLRSVERALIEVGAKPLVTSDPAEIAKAGRIVVPGQGAFGDCVDSLRAHGLDHAIREHVSLGRPYFGICLGLQILFESSQESPKVAGLGLMPGKVERFPATVGKVPHMGWNSVKATKNNLPLLDGIDDETFFYFTHSYFAVPQSTHLTALECDYGGPFVAAVQRDNIFACQFHPEKSQAAGLKLLSNFITQ